ncbi:hypothetical protein VP01_4924g1 [Puccinia sorghi]|uniref:Uncharacterized protein n=1 Tax=Puccinia sorghi TaxID=27349 RepID=A0A0L6UM30_9BASI|nr:hypothetical protein VP01_4924g1 [Puccinia sorghi]
MYFRPTSQKLPTVIFILFKRDPNINTPEPSSFEMVIVLNCLQLTCRKSKKASVVTTAILQKLFNQALMHRHCSDYTVTVPKHLHMQTCGVWIAWLEHAACQMQAPEFTSKSSVGKNPWSNLIFYLPSLDMNTEKTEMYYLGSEDAIRAPLDEYNSIFLMKCLFELLVCPTSCHINLCFLTALTVYYMVLLDHSPFSKFLLLEILSLSLNFFFFHFKLPKSANVIFIYIMKCRIFTDTLGLAVIFSGHINSYISLLIMYVRCIKVMKTNDDGISQRKTERKELAQKPTRAGLISPIQTEETKPPWLMNDKKRVEIELIELVDLAIYQMR